MNERIFELSIQAKREFDEHVAECEQQGKQIVWVTQERLVELVVRECMDLVKDCYAEAESGKSQYQTVCASTIIGDHFGVTE